MNKNGNIIVGLLAREIDHKSSNRIGVTYKTCEFHVPIDIKSLKPYKFKSPIRLCNYPHIIEVVSKIHNADKQFLLATEKVIDKAKILGLPLEAVNTGSTGTGSAAISLLLKSNTPNDILGISPCDQLQTWNVNKAIKKGIRRIRRGEINSFTIIAKNKKFEPSFGHFLYSQNKKAMKFIQKNNYFKNRTKYEMGEDTMIVYFKKDYILDKMKKAIENNHPSSKIIKKHLNLIESKVDINLFFNKTPFSDFSSLYHPLLISDMGVEIVDYGIDWDDWGTWQKFYNSPYVPKDKDNNVILTNSEKYSLKNVINCIIINFLDKGFILHDLNRKLVAIGERGLIVCPYNYNSIKIGALVKKLQL